MAVFPLGRENRGQFQGRRDRSEIDGTSRWQQEHAENAFPAQPASLGSGTTLNGFNICLSYLESEKYT